MRWCVGFSLDELNPNISKKKKNSFLIHQSWECCTFCGVSLHRNQFKCDTNLTYGFTSQSIGANMRTAIAQYCLC